MSNRPLASVLLAGLTCLALAGPGRAQMADAERGGPGRAQVADAERGGRLYEKAECGQCHGPLGLGDGPVGLALEQIGKSPGNWSDPETFKLDTDEDGKPGTDDDLWNVIRRGALVFGGSQMMGPTKGLSDDDLADLIAFIRSLAAR